MDPLKAYESKTQFDAFSEDDVPTPFTDTVGAAFALTRREELSDSSHRAFVAENEKRAKVIGELGGDEALANEYAFTIPESVREQIREDLKNGPVTSSRAYQILNPRHKQAVDQMLSFQQLYPEQVVTDEAIFHTFKERFAELRAEDNFAIERGGGGAAFLGTAGAIFTDPLVITTLPFGAEIGAGRTLAQTIGRTAAIEGAIGAAVEIPIQAEVFRFKRELESPWSFQASAINVLSAGVGGAALGGTIGGGVFAGREALKNYRANKAELKVTAEMDEAEQILEDTIGLHDENPLESPIVDGDGNPGPKPEVEHEQAFEKARAQSQDNQPVDVAEDIELLEPQDAINETITRAGSDQSLVEIDPTELEIDAKTFQFKSGADGAGVTDALQGVTRFDRRLAGVSLVWENSKGVKFVADGHQRAALGKRALEAGQPPEEVKLNAFVVREADGVSAEDAMRMAAVKNMAEGSGSALDAAKILRGVGPMGESLLPPLPPQSALVRQARGLAGLGEDEFLQVVNGVIDERFGALVGAATTDSKLQSAMIQVLKRTQPANETQARSIVDQVRTAGVETKITEDLFGSNTITESLYLERAQVLDAALRESRKDKAVFGRLLSEEGRITEAGSNKLDRIANMERLQEASNATQKISRLANTKGPISEALTEAARQVKEGKKPADVAQSFLETARREVIAGDSSRGEAGGARPGGDPAGSQGSVKLTKGAPLRVKEMAAHERAMAMNAVIAKQRTRTIDEIYKRAKANQGRLSKAAKQIADELGEDIVLADPGIKAKKTATEKLKRKGKTPGEITDTIRLGFMVRTPELASKVIDRLAETFEVLDEGLSVTAMGYVDHKALVRFSDGSVGEVQLWDPALAAAKFGEGEEIYAGIRSVSEEDLASDPALAGRVLAAQESSKDLYANALARASAEWRREAMMILPEDMRARVQAAVEAGGSGGEFGNISRNAFRESSEPDSRISTGEARDQASASDGTKKPSSPPAGVSRTTAGRASQLKNRSAIDAAPRKIVRDQDTTRIPAPDASRTGTVPDTEYEAVMAKAQDLIDKEGEQIMVANEINGELQTRSLASAIEELDNLEDVLERVRLCSAPVRRVS